MLPFSDSFKKNGLCLFAFFLFGLFSLYILNSGSLNENDVPGFFAIGFFLFIFVPWSCAKDLLWRGLSRHGLLIFSLFFSTGILLLLISFQAWMPQMMELNASWLSTAALPVVVVVTVSIVSRLFQKIPSELAARLDTPIHLLVEPDLIKDNIIANSNHISATSHINQINIKKNATHPPNRLIFIVSEIASNNYNHQVVRSYLTSLSSLICLEIRDRNGFRIGLLDVDSFKNSDGSVNTNKIDQLVAVLSGEKPLKETFKEDIISPMENNMSLLQILEYIERFRVKKVVLTSKDNNSFILVLNQTMVNALVAHEILMSRGRLDFSS